MSKSQYSLNKIIEGFVSAKKISGEAWTKEELALANDYTGMGGLAKYGASGKGLLSEYYTPIQIVELMHGLAIKHGFKKGPILEPSCGTGRFLRYLSPKEKVDAFEINETAYAIAKANHPTFNIQLKYFNELFVDRTGNIQKYDAKYNLVIGNPPYGKFTGKYSSQEKTRTKIKQYESYFIYRSLDLLLPDGLLVFIIPSSFLAGKEDEAKRAILSKSKLLEAYRLPKGIFKQTQVQTDIIVLKKK